LTGPEDAVDITIELMDTPGEDMKNQLKSFALLRKKIREVEDNLAKGITMDSLVEQNVQKYDEEFPSLGGPSPDETKEEVDSKQQAWRENDKEQKEIWTSRYVGKLYQYPVVHEIE